MARLHAFFDSPAQKRTATELYIALVKQSRNPFFYSACAVPDTLDGRFDVLLLHVFLALEKPEHQDPGFRRRVLERFFDDMDRSLREMGVGDMGVAKRIKAMAKAAFGRLEAYRAALQSDEALKEALARNIYRGGSPAPEAIVSLTRYVRDYL